MENEFPVWGLFEEVHVQVKLVIEHNLGNHVEVARQATQFGFDVLAGRVAQPTHFHFDAVPLQAEHERPLVDVQVVHLAHVQYLDATYDFKQDQQNTLLLIVVSVEWRLIGGALGDWIRVLDSTAIFRASCTSCMRCSWTCRIYRNGMFNILQVWKYSVQTAEFVVWAVEFHAVVILDVLTFSQVDLILLLLLLGVAGEKLFDFGSYV